MVSSRSLEIAQCLQNYERFGIDLGLDRILHLLKRLNNPHQKVLVIHVAGTNGKGSVCAYLSSVLAAAGYRVGRYTSPHLIDWPERIHLNEQPIASERLLAVLKRVEAAIDPSQPTPTQFEVLTAAAWCIFAEAAVEVAVIEVGLGGRLDATNVCDRPLASVITSISREHWQRLGPTLADIAREKAGVLKAGCPAIIGPLPPDAEQVVRQRIKTLNCSAIWPKSAQWLPDQSHPWAAVAGITYPLLLLGDMQLINSALAIATLKTLRQQGWSISDEAIQTGMANTQWPGRLQWTEWQGMKLLIDGAHNPAAAQVLRQYLDQCLKQHPQSIHWLMGMLSTKDHSDIFAALLRPGDHLTLVPVAEHSTAEPKELAGLALSICPALEACDTALSLTEGLQRVGQAGRSSECLPVLCGSLYLIGEFLSLRNDQNTG